MCLGHSVKRRVELLSDTLPVDKLDPLEGEKTRETMPAKSTVRICWEHMVEPCISVTFNSQFQKSNSQILGEIGEIES